MGSIYSRVVSEWECEGEWKKLLFCPPLSLSLSLSLQNPIDWQHITDCLMISRPPIWHLTCLFTPPPLPLPPLPLSHLFSLRTLYSLLSFFLSLSTCLWSHRPPTYSFQAPPFLNTAHLDMVVPWKTGMAWFSRFGPPMKSARKR